MDILGDVDIFVLCGCGYYSMAPTIFDCIKFVVKSYVPTDRMFFLWKIEFIEKTMTSSYYQENDLNSSSCDDSERLN